VSRGQITSVDPWRVFFNHAAAYEMPHMILAAYMVTGFTVAGVYAAGILHGRRDRYHYTRVRDPVRPGRRADSVPDLRR
jgi:cytochrome d ubiquinol oxidase subunit I